MLALVLAAIVSASPTGSAEGGNVILITWDGVRWQDFFERGESAPFARLWSRHAARCTVYGDPKVEARFEVSNPALLSLPSYQEMMVGQSVPCSSNQCGRVEAPTLIDGLVKAGLGGKMAVVASWEKIAKAVSANDLPFVNAGKHEHDGLTPWGGARFDKDTWPRAMAALDARPRFLWISLNDADEWAHRGSRDTYLGILRRYDIWFDGLVQKLAAMPGYGEHTTVIVTTDHGRGDGEDWTSHDSSLPMAKRIFAFALGPSTGGVSTTSYTHAAIRPTIEALLGLAPSATVMAGVMPSGSAAVAASP